MSNGTLAICRKDPCLDDVIIDGFNGYQYENFSDFKKYLEIIFSDKEKKEELSKNARSYSVKNFSIEYFGINCENLYKKLIKKDD